MLYVCATPIGNLRDITIRALDILANSDIILCEDTRTSKHLLASHNIAYKKLLAFHEHNEVAMTSKILDWLKQGLVITQISDAGTPGISDPGARLCTQVLEHHLPLSPLPGACAYTSLLSVAGVLSPSLFYGFLPVRHTARCNVLKQWYDVDYAIALYEAPHRILATMEDIVSTLGATRQMVMGRELTKQFETIKALPAHELLAFIQADNNQQRGEFVLLIKPNVISKRSAAQSVKELSSEQINMLRMLVAELPPKKAVQLTHKLVGGDKTLLYNYVIHIDQS